MSESTECPVCGGEVGPATRPWLVRVYCSSRCSNRAADRRRERRKTDRLRSEREQRTGEVESGTAECGWCGEVMPAFTAGQKRTGCSPGCKQRLKDARKTERYRNDPEYRREILARQERYRRAAGVKPKYPGGESTCEWCGEVFPAVDAGRPKRFCGVRCQARAWKDQDQYLRGRPRVSLTGWLPDGHHGWIYARVSCARGLMIDCPDCGCMMGVRCEVETKWDRWCPGCGLTLSIEPEEAECVISKALPPAKAA